GACPRLDCVIIIHAKLPRQTAAENHLHLDASVSCIPNACKVCGITCGSPTDRASHSFDSFVRRTSHLFIKLLADKCVRVANLCELSYFCAIDRDPGNSSAASESSPYGLPLAACPRRCCSACAIGVSRLSLGDETDLRRNADPRRPGR